MNRVHYPLIQRSSLNVHSVTITHGRCLYSKHMQHHEKGRLIKWLWSNGIFQQKRHLIWLQFSYRGDISEIVTKYNVSENATVYLKLENQRSIVSYSVHIRCQYTACARLLKHIHNVCTWDIITRWNDTAHTRTPNSTHHRIYKATKHWSISQYTDRNFSQ